MRLILWPFQFGCFWIFSSSLVPPFAFSFLRSMSRAAFFCFFSRRAVSFCRFLKVSLAINTPFQLSVPRSQRYVRLTAFSPSGCFMLFSHIESLVELFLGRTFCFSHHF